MNFNKHVLIHSTLDKKNKALNIIRIPILVLIIPVILLSCTRSTDEIYNEMAQEYGGINELKIKAYMPFLDEHSSEDMWYKEFTGFCKHKDWTIDECHKQVNSFKDEKYKRIKNEKNAAALIAENAVKENIKNGYEKEYRSESLNSLMQHRYIQDTNITIGENFKSKHKDLNCNFDDNSIKCKIGSDEFIWILSGSATSPKDFSRLDLNQNNVLWFPANDNAKKQFTEITNLIIPEVLVHKNLSHDDKKTVDDVVSKMTPFLEKIKSFLETQGVKSKVVIEYPDKDKVGDSWGHFHVEALREQPDQEYSDFYFSLDPTNDNISLTIRDGKRDFIKEGLKPILKILLKEVFSNDEHSELLSVFLEKRIKQNLNTEWSGNKNGSHLPDCRSAPRTESLHSIEYKMLYGINVKIDYPCKVNKFDQLNRYTGFMITFKK